MRFGAVILSYGSAVHHVDLIRSLLEEGLQPEQILLVHNPDGTAAGARPEPAGQVEAVVMERNVGYGAAMNVGLERWRARGADWVLLLTHDVCPRRGAVEALVTAAERNAEYAILGPVLLEPGGRTFSFGGLTTLSDNITTHRAVDPGDGEHGIAPCDWVDGAALMLRLQAASQVGPIDERFFMYFEEAELCLRVRRAGWRVGVVLASEMLTSPGRSRRPLAFGYLFARNGLHYARRAGGARGMMIAIGSQVRTTRYLVSMPFARRFWDRDFRRAGYAHAVGIWLGILAAVRRESGPPPRFIRRMSDIRGVEPRRSAPPPWRRCTPDPTVGMARDGSPRPTHSTRL